MNDMAMGALFGSMVMFVMLQLTVIYFQRQIVRLRHDNLASTGEAVMWEFLFERSNERLALHVAIGQEMSALLREMAFDADCDSEFCVQARSSLRQFAELMARTSPILDFHSDNS